MLASSPGFPHLAVPGMKVASFVVSISCSLLPRLFCRVGEFIRLHLPQLFPSVKKPLLFGLHEEKGAASEDSIMAARGLLTLSEAIVKALDMR